MHVGFFMDSRNPNWPRTSASLCRDDKQAELSDEVLTSTTKISGLRAILGFLGFNSAACVTNRFCHACMELHRDLEPKHGHELLIGPAPKRGQVVAM